MSEEMSENNLSVRLRIGGYANQTEGGMGEGHQEEPAPVPSSSAFAIAKHLSPINHTLCKIQQNICIFDSGSSFYGLSDCTSSSKEMQL